MRRVLLHSCLVLALAAPIAGETPSFLGDDPLGVPLRMRDFTFPSHLYLGFTPAPAAPLGKGTLGLELHWSKVNDFQVSSAAEAYLEATRAPGERRPLSEADAAAILALPDGDSFYVDGEYDYLEFAATYGLTDRLDVSVTLNYVKFGGGALDGTIFDFHDQFDFGQQGRNFVQDNNFQIVMGLGPEDLVVLRDELSDGFADPFIFLRYAIPSGGSGVRLGVAGSVKPPLADEDEGLSTGNWDVGLQLTADKRWRRNALILNLSLVSVGEFEAVRFEPGVVPALQTTWIHRFGKAPRLRFLLQVLTAEHVFGDFLDSEFTEPEFQATIGLKWTTRLGVWGLGLTENIQNMDNTPDIGLHFSWGAIFD